MWRSNEDYASRIIVGMPNHSIEDRFVIDKILSHLADDGVQELAIRRPAGAKRTAASGLLNS